MDTGTSKVYCCEPLVARPSYLRGWFDGGKRPKHELCSCGWHVEAAWCLDDAGQPIWRQAAYGSVLLDPETTTVDAELTGLEQAVGAIAALAQSGSITFEHPHVSNM